MGANSNCRMLDGGWAVAQAEAAVSTSMHFSFLNRCWCEGYPVHTTRVYLYQAVDNAAGS